MSSRAGLALEARLKSLDRAIGPVERSLKVPLQLLHICHAIVAQAEIVGEVDSVRVIFGQPPPDRDGFLVGGLSPVRAAGPRENRPRLTISPASSL